MEAKEARRYFILVLDVSQEGQVILLDRKLPSHFFHCSGIFATVKGFLDTGKDISQIGEVSILFNSGQVHPFHHFVGYSQIPLQKKILFMEVSEPLVPNYRISGFYADARASFDRNGIFLPYTLNIYFDCKVKL